VHNGSPVDELPSHHKPEVFTKEGEKVFHGSMTGRFKSEQEGDYFCWFSQTSPRFEFLSACGTDLEPVITWRHDRARHRTKVIDLG